MKINDQEFTVLKNGDVEAAQIYKEINVVQQIEGEDVVLGVQPEYRILNIIHKDKIPMLLKFLKKQKSFIESKIKAADEVIERLKHIDLQVLSSAINKVPKDKLGSKKLQDLNRLSEDYYMKQGAIDNKKVLQENITKFEEQIKFFEKLV